MTKSQIWEKQKTEEIQRQYRASFSNINYQLPSEKEASLESKGATKLILLAYGIIVFDSLDRFS